MSGEQRPKTENSPAMIQEMARAFLMNFSFLQQVVDGLNDVPALFVDIKSEGYLVQTFIAPENQPLYMYPKNGQNQILHDESNRVTTAQGYDRTRIFNIQSPLEVGRIRAMVSADGGTRFSFYDATHQDMAFELIEGDSLEDYIISGIHPAHIRNDDE